MIICKFYARFVTLENDLRRAKMGRMTKQGIDYFSLDVQFDDKLELYLLEHESNGLAVFIVLLQLIYSNEGYYTTNGKDLALLIKKRINLDIDIITSCINAMISREIFDKDLYKKYNILTSRGIQKRFFDAAKRKKEVRVIREYLLTDINVYTNLISVNINNKNVSNNATKEEEEEEEEEKEDKKATKDEYEFPLEITSKYGLKDKYIEWLSHRKEMKFKKLTQKGVNSQIKFLLKQPDPIGVIDQSIMNGYQGLFELKGVKNGAHKPVATADELYKFSESILNDDRLK